MKEEIEITTTDGAAVGASDWPVSYFPISHDDYPAARHNVFWRQACM